MQSNNPQKDSNAWIFQTWAAFVLSISMTTIGIVNLPVTNWVKGFIKLLFEEVQEIGETVNKLTLQI